MDICTETLISFTAAAKCVPGGRRNVATIYRWAYQGVRGVRLESVVIGGQRRTSREAILRFIRESTAAADRALTSSTVATVPADDSPTAAARAADARLSRAGY